MNGILETPWPGLIVGALTTAILIGGFLKTQRLAVLIAAGVAMLLTVGWVVLERIVVTEREEVQGTLYAIAEAVERDDQETVMDHIAQSADTIRGAARLAMKTYVISEAKIKRNLTVDIDRPGRAVAEFNALLVGGDRAGLVQQQRYPRHFKVTFVREGEGWKVSDYEHSDFRDGL
ncbi:MAG: hypothetical protein KDA60_20530 [Planctomycetales bacterium]|nr:hypothetical protein [Planctomycetales bacterium]